MNAATRFGWRLLVLSVAWQVGAFSWFVVAGYMLQLGTP